MADITKLDKFIKIWCVRREISLSELYADIHSTTGISAPSLVHWKKGRRTPQIKKVSALAEYFDVTSEAMLDLLNSTKG